ncbi:Hypothetical protein R9X50_00409600 [Acrodontium crateriforme]|uniref:N-acetyltransferase domain-containing protein n=1 Tax=Acrodontium crateriforme TaxID=150365 RepID=A0AAQ3RCF2_9PEZI|nr:Hypothetical protein R9X50_00409600 [Acrodontium crateriforme]
MSESRQFYRDEQYEICRAQSTDEYRATWWNYMEDQEWNQHPSDLDSYANSLHEKSVILLLDRKQGDKIIGHIGLFAYDNATGWISLFVVDPAYRGLGLGGKLLDAALSDARNAGIKFLGLDSVPAQRQTYSRRGFVAAPRGIIKSLKRPIPDLAEREALRRAVAQDEKRDQLIDLRSISPPFLPKDLIGYESTITGFTRPQLWSEEHMFQRSDIAGWALESSTTSSNATSYDGWVLLRQCSEGFGIGPLYAKDAQSAKLLLQAVMSQPDFEQASADGCLVAEVCESNEATMTLFEGLGWDDSGDYFCRMWMDGNMPSQQTSGGEASKHVFAVFDAITG